MLGSLLTYCKEEDGETLELLYRTYKNKMFYIALKLLEDSSEAENIVHDTFLILSEHLERIGNIKDKKTWNYIVTILKNRCFYTAVLQLNDVYSNIIHLKKGL